jgi:pyruvate/2-oxoglutarate/acetoin dehydrogenase E1 component
MVTGVDRLNQTLRRLIEMDHRVVVFGEDLLDPYGGAFKVTKGLQRDFPERVRTTPISEGLLVGLGNGLALCGMRPIVEIMFGDFLTLCVDQLVNHAAKFGPMFGGRVRVPLVVRTPMGAGRGYGPTHSQSIEKLFFGVPHLEVFAVNALADPGVALEDAVRSERPTVFVEHKLLYPAAVGAAAEGLEVTHDRVDGADLTLVRNFRSGDAEVLLVLYGGMTRHLNTVMHALADEEVRAEAFVPTRIMPFPTEHLIERAARAGRVLVVEEGSRTAGWGAEVAAVLQEGAFGRLKVPVRRLASLDTIIPAARHLEAATVPGHEGIISSALDLLS